MPTAKLFFGNQQATGDSSLAGAPEIAYNVVIDRTGAVRRRPGIVAWDGFPDEAPVSERIDGVHAFQGDLYYVTESRKVFQVSGGLAADFSTAGAGSFLAGTSRPTFAETQFRLVIAGGLAPSKVDAGATNADLLGGSPPDSSQVIALASRIFSNDLTSATTAGRIRYSKPGAAGNEEWPVLSFTSAEARTDSLVALRENSNELFAFGETTLQVFVPDPSLTLVPQRAVNRGCGAPGSVIRADEHFAWLDDQTEFVVGDGRAMDIVSSPISATLEEIGTVSDAWGTRIKIGQTDLLAWQFPTDGRTFAYQQGSGWAQWSAWDEALGHTPWPVTAHYYWPSQRLHLVGTADGRIAQLSATAGTDLGDPIRAEVTTGFINHGTDAIKFTDGLRLTFRRSSTAASPSYALLSWRNDTGPFEEPRRIDLGSGTDYTIQRELRTLGGYRRRQWQLTWPPEADFVLAGAEEEFSLGSS
jgi:hypothetical protein